MKFPSTDKKGLELSKFSHFSRNLAGFKEYDLHTPVHNGNCWLVFLYWAYLAYQGQMFEVPFVTNFIKNQGWA